MFIKKTPHFYQPDTKQNTVSFLTCDTIKVDHPDYNSQRNDIIESDDREYLQAIIDDLESGTYYYQHNEAGRPEYEIVDGLTDVGVNESEIEQDAIYTIMAKGYSSVEAKTLLDKLLGLTVSCEDCDMYYTYYSDSIKVDHDYYTHAKIQYKVPSENAQWAEDNNNLGCLNWNNYIVSFY